MYVDQFCAFVWFLSIKDKDPEEIEMIKGQLWIPPEGQEVTDRRSPWHPDNQLNQLRRVKAGAGSSATSTRSSV